uniref:Uncharacterized protein n=1 Tax=Anopheles maculatus TaxID=74869 RepID=A0A182SNZ6_9DIPT
MASSLNTSQQFGSYPIDDRGHLARTGLTTIRLRVHASQGSEKWQVSRTSEFMNALRTAVYMTTTVPQNFTKNASTLIGRHKPTRSSLRHSRMLVVNKTVPVRYPPGNSLNLRHLRLCRTVMILQILIGLLLNVIGLAIMVWSPSTNTKDNPYWSGLILIICGVLFLALFQFKRVRNGTTKGGSQNVSRLLHQQQSPWRENCFHFLRVNALIVLLLTIFFTMLAFIYALIHATNLSAEGLRCEPQFTFNVNSSTCVCTIDTRAARAPMSTMVANTTNPADDVGMNDTLPIGGAFNLSNGDDSRAPEGVIRLEYRDFNCNEVHSIWYYVMIVSTILNLAGCLLATTFLVIYSVECIRRSDRSTNRAKNGGESGERMVDNAIAATNNPISSLQPSPNSAPDASTQPLLVTVATQPQSRLPDTSLLSSGSKQETGGHTADTTTLSVEETTLTTILSDEEDKVLMS